MERSHTGRFSTATDQLPKLLQEFNTCQISKLSDAPKQPGVYGLISDLDAHAYIGRARNIHKRLKQHCSKQITQATWAIKLAREATGIRAEYTKDTSIKHLMNNHAGFAAAFHDARATISAMRVRFVLIEDDLMQMLFEAYAICHFNLEHKQPFRTT